MKLLFVCTGNTCRSPMLEFAFKQYLALRDIKDIEVDSAGILNHKKPMAIEAAAVLSAHGVPYVDRLSEFCSEKEIRKADFVITATVEQAEILRNAYNCTEIISMKDVIGRDVPDPYGGGLEAYENVYEIICDALPQILDYIKNRR